MSCLSLRNVILCLLLVGLIVPFVSSGNVYAQDEADAAEDANVLERFDAWFGEHVVTPMDSVLFFKVGLEDTTDADGNPVVKALPLIVIVLLVGGVFFTLRYGLINLRLLAHSVEVVRGKFDDPEDAGEVSHFKALTSALSATVGLGNIAGVAIAITAGGPGAVFWMWCTAFFGMSMKFSSATFAQLYRVVHDDGRVLGGPMVYLDEGIRERYPALAPLGKFLAYLFAVLTILAAFSAGNMFQANQTASIVMSQFFPDNDSPLIPLMLGIVMAALVGAVIIGGIRRIGELTSKLVPTMCIFYCSVCLIIVLLNVSQVPSLIASIFTSAFSPDAMFGGFLGVLVQGMRRAAFSNEAGLGSASIAQAAAKTKEPVQAGVVAMLGPVIDTMVVCTMTALAILITKAHLSTDDIQGVEVTALAFAQLGWAVPYVLCLAVFIFGYSTMISWGYYGERAAEFLFGERAILPYRFTHVAVVVIGPLLSLKYVVDFADMLLLSMAFPNIIGMALISGKVKALTQDYMERLRSGALNS